MLRYPCGRIPMSGDTIKEIVGQGIPNVYYLITLTDAEAYEPMIQEMLQRCPDF